MGYAESKNVAEHILFEARKVNLPSTILRIGQIAGPIAFPGIWNPDEWVPSLIQSSQSMGYLPNSLPLIDWIPIDRLSQTIIELALPTGRPQPSFYNLVNPNPISWSALLPTIRESMLSPSHPSPISVIDFKEWISRLQSLDAGDPAVVERYPAIKILPFFLALAEQKESTRYETAAGVRDSVTMAALGPIDGGAMRKWMGEWGYGMGL
ncbi:MAG: hypothetical protein Q9169_008015 [Polycauliona sp. 2 TL-2023]